MVDLKTRTKTEMIFITKISLQRTANIQITCSGGVGVLYVVAVGTRSY